MLREYEELSDDLRQIIEWWEDGLLTEDEYHERKERVLIKLRENRYYTG